MTEAAPGPLEPSATRRTMALVVVADPAIMQPRQSEMAAFAAVTCRESKSEYSVEQMKALKVSLTVMQIFRK